MGYIKHHAIIVTTWSNEGIEKVLEQAKVTFNEGMVSNVLISKANGYYTVVIGPDGSKEGWDTSDEADYKRKEFVDWLNTMQYSDGSNSYRYCEFYYGDDYGESEIINHN